MLTVFSYAQDVPKAEVFGGYQYTRLDGQGVVPDINANGWNGAITENLNHWFGVTGDFSGAYAKVLGADTNLYTYTFGPVIATRANDSFTPFVHALFGGFHASAGAGGFSASTSGFATQVGGGVDAKLGPSLAVRVAQFDWMLLRSEGETSKKNIRVSTGLVFRF
jgi:hypothetical protein